MALSDNAGHTSHRYKEKLQNHNVMPSLYILLYFKFFGYFTALVITHFVAINPKIRANLTAK
jgi:hypothetical protein